jgi:hypothetical protein
MSNGDDEPQNGGEEEPQNGGEEEPSNGGEEPEGGGGEEQPSNGGEEPEGGGGEEQPTDDQPATAEAGEPAESGEEVADAGVPSSDELDELDRQMSTDRKEMGPQDEAEAEAQLAETEEPPDIAPTEVA